MGLIRRDDNSSESENDVAEILKKQLRILSEESTMLHNQSRDNNESAPDNRLDKLALLTDKMVNVAKMLEMGSKLGNMLDTVTKTKMW